jgi:response regulator of citrate/malate metabolism
MTQEQKNEWQRRYEKGQVVPTYKKVTLSAVLEWKRLLAEGFSQEKAAIRVGFPKSSLRYYLKGQ